MVARLVSLTILGRPLISQTAGVVEPSGVEPTPVDGIYWADPHFDSAYFAKAYFA